MSLQARYTILRKIADGGTAEIFLANQRGVHGFEKLVVLKRIFPAYYADPEFRNMLVNEARIAMSLNHSNIVQVLDLGEDEGQYILALELVDGWTLDAVIRRVRAARSSMPPALALHVTAEVCRALAYAHAKVGADGKPIGIVHRDISPHNVLLSEQGEVKLTDFGIATVENQREEGPEKIIRGKIAYMSPEQASGGQLDARSDLYSVGTMLYVMLCGRYPFDAPTDLGLLLLVKSGQFVSPETARPGLHPELVRLVTRLMAADVAVRYQSADAVLADVEQIMRTAFRSVGQTELKRWLQDLSIRDGVPALTKASPVVTTAQAGRVLGASGGTRDPAAPVGSSSATTAPHRAPPPPVPAAARAVSSGVRPPPPRAALSVSRRTATSITVVPGGTDRSRAETSAASGADRTGSLPSGQAADDDSAEIWTPEPDEATPTPVTVTSGAVPAPVTASATGPAPADGGTAAATDAPASEVTAPGNEERPARQTRLTPGPSLPSMIALSSTATVPPPSKVVPAPPTGNSGLHTIPPPPVSSEILAALGSDPLTGLSASRGARGGASAVSPEPTAFPGSINTLPAPARSRRGLVIGAGLVGVLAIIVSIKTCSSGHREDARLAARPVETVPGSGPAGGAKTAPAETGPVTTPVVVALPPAAGATAPAADAQLAAIVATGDAAGRPTEIDTAPKSDAGTAEAATPGAVVVAIDAGGTGSPEATRTAEPTVAAGLEKPPAPRADTPPAPPAEAPHPAVAEARPPAVEAHPPAPVIAPKTAETNDPPAPPTAPAPSPEGKADGDAKAGAAAGEESADQSQKVMVTVKSVPPGARVTTAHHDYGTTPVSIRFRSGNTYALVLTHEGFRPTKQRIEVTTDPDQEVTVTLTLKKPGGAPPSPPASVPPAASAAPPPPPAPKPADDPSWWQKMFKKR